MSQTYRLTPDMSVHGVVDTKIDFWYNHIHFTAVLHTPRKIVSGALKTPRNQDGGPVPENFAEFTLDPAQNPTLSVLTEYFSDICKRHNYSGNQHVDLLRSYVQSLPYEYGIEEARRQYYPVETASLGTGVCSDKSLLLCSLLASADFSTAMVRFPGRHHAMCGVKASDVSKSFQQTGYLLIETTNRSSIISRLPEDKMNLDYTFTPIGDGQNTYEI